MLIRGSVLLATVFCSFIQAGDCAGSQPELITLGSGSGSVGDDIVLPLYVRDVPGTCIDTGGGEGYAGIFLQLQFDPALVEELELMRAGLSTSVAGVPIFFASGPSQDGITTINIIAGNPGLFPLNSGAAAPGDLVAELRIRPAAAASGQTIGFTALETNTLLQNGGGDIELRLSNGLLAVALGQVQVGAVTEPPVINQFSADPETIDRGGASTLTWDVADADTVQITSLGDVVSSGSDTVRPVTTTTYTLNASNSAGSVSDTVTVTVLEPLPEILSFAASATEIIDGESIALSWEVVDADLVMITPGIGSVDAIGEMTVTPTEDTTYTLTATNARGSDTADLDIEVFPRLAILSFEAEPAQISPGQTSRLSWQVENSASVTLSGVAGEQAPSGFIDVMPDETTDYTLTATGALGQELTSQVRLDVVSDPALLLDATEVDLGGETETAMVILTKNTNAERTWSVAGVPSWLQLSETGGSISDSAVALTLAVDRFSFFPGQARAATLVFTAPDHADTELVVRANRAGEADGVTVLVFPLVDAEDGRQVELVLVNTGETALSVLIQAFSETGSTVTGRTVPISAGGSHTEIFTNFRGWAAASVDDGEGQPAPLVGVANTRSADGEELYTLSPVAASDTEILVPHIAKDPQFFTVSSVVNLGSGVDALRFDTPEVDTVDLGGMGSGTSLFFDYRADLFGGGDIPGPGYGRLGFESGTLPLAGVEVFGRNPEVLDLQQSVGVSLSSRTSTELTFVHIARDTANFWTGIVAINPGSEPAEVEIRAYDVDGNLLDELTQRTFAPGEKVAWAVTDTSQPFGPGAAWLQLISDQPMTGYELFGTLGEADQWAGFEAVTDLGTRLIVPHLEEGVRDGGFTGIAIINPNPTDLALTLALVDASGVVKETALDTVAPFLQKLSIVSALFTSPIEEGDHVVVTGDLPMAGFELYGFSNRTLGAIIAPVQE